jgi:hypothetical protein
MNKHIKKFDALILSGVLVFILFLGFIINPENIVFQGVNPHPYLLISILISSFYGYRVSIFSGVTLSLVYLVILNLQLDYEEVETILDFKYLGVPLAIIIISPIVGELKQRTLDENKNLKSKIDENKEIIDYNLDEQKLLERENNELKRRLISRLDTMKTLFESAKKLGGHREELLAENLVSILVEHLDVNRVALYKKKVGDVYEVWKSYGDSENIIEDEINIGETKSIVLKEVFKSKKVVNLSEINSVSEFEETKDRIILSGPFLDEFGAIEGFICIYSMPFLNYIPSNFKLLQLYMEWFSLTWQRAIEFSDAITNNIVEEEFGIFKYSYFYDRIAEEFERAKTFMLPLTLIKIKFKNYHSIFEENIIFVKKIIAKVILDEIRKIDCFAEGEKENEWNIILPIIEANETDQLVSKLKSNIESLEMVINESGEKIDLDWQIISFHPNMKEVSDFVG